MMYPAIFVVSAIAALLLCPVVIRLGVRLKVVDAPGLRKVHQRPVPRMGGLAILLGMAAAGAMTYLFYRGTGTISRGTSGGIVAILFGAGLLFGTGLVDDVMGLRPRVKLLVQIAAAAAVCAVGVRIHSLHVHGWFHVQLGWWSWPLTMLWIVGVTNAVNFIDGLDGLAGGIMLLASATLAALAWWTNMPVLAGLMLGVAGGTAGFLLFNLHPARLFLGDCGTLMVGFLLAAGSVYAAGRSGALLGLGVAGLVLGVPILDMCFSVLRRLIQRRSIFAPDRGHIHHRLLDMGVEHGQAVLLIHTLSLGTAGLAMFMLRGSDSDRVGVLLCTLGLLVVVFRRVGAVQLGECVQAMRKNWRIGRQVEANRRLFEDAQLRLRSARTAHQWWQAVCAVAEQMNFQQMKLVEDAPGGEGCRLSWQHRPSLSRGRVLRVAVPVCPQIGAGAWWIRLEVPVRASLEAAGHKAALFVRLIEEFGLPTGELSADGSEPVRVGPDDDESPYSAAA